jgi:energy-coupling factor transport system ATP-binding protein
LVNGLLTASGVGDGDSEGWVRVFGFDPGVTPTAQLAQRVGSVFQDPRTQFFTTDVLSELAFGGENLGWAPARIRARLDEVSARWGLDGLLGRSVFALSGGQKQRVICAAVDLMDPPALVLDEPSANLDAEASARLAQAVADWKARGKAVLIAEHRLAYLIDAADRFIRLEAGRITHHLTPTQLTALGPATQAALSLRPIPPPNAAAAPKTPGGGGGMGLVEMREVGYWRRVGPASAGVGRGRHRQVVRIDHLTVRAGEIVALTGPNGAGKTTALRWLAGVARGGRGELVVDGVRWGRRRRLGGVALVGQDVNVQLFANSVLGEVRLARRGLSADDAAAILDRFDLRHLAARHPLTLSAGERQRLAIAAALAAGRPLIALDEPTSGLDLAHMRQAAAALQELAAQGRAVLVATHDQDLIAACATKTHPLTPPPMATPTAQNASGPPGF